MYYCIHVVRCVKACFETVCYKENFDSVMKVAFLSEHSFEFIQGKTLQSSNSTKTNLFLLVPVGGRFLSTI